MKKFFIIIILIVLAAGVWKFWPQLKLGLSRAPQLAQIIQNSPAVQTISQKVFTGGPLRGTEDSPDAFLTRAGTINQTNLQRKQNGNLPALAENSLLDKAAQNKLADIFTQQYFEHVSPQGKGPADLAKNVGYQYVIIGENLALGNFKDDAALVQAWMNSPGHRANILQPKYQDIGVAVGQGIYQGKKVWVAVQEFGRPLSSCPAVDVSLKDQIVSVKADVDSILPQLQSLKNQIDSAPEPKTQNEANAYNQMVTQYNDLVKIYNNKVDLLKQDTAVYNAEVEAFNLCAQ